MPKTIESRSLSAPPSHTTSPKAPNRTAHPLSTQLFPVSNVTKPPQTLPLKHAWRRRWSKSSRLQKSNVPKMHVMLDARMALQSVRITTPSDKELILPLTRNTSKLTPIPDSHQTPEQRSPDSRINGI